LLLRIAIKLDSFVRFELAFELELESETGDELEKTSRAGRLVRRGIVTKLTDGGAVCRSCGTSRLLPLHCCCAVLKKLD
jgi:hypothetical protein